MGKRSKRSLLYREHSVTVFNNFISSSLCQLQPFLHACCKNTYKTAYYMHMHPKSRNSCHAETIEYKKTVLENHHHPQNATNILVQVKLHCNACISLMVIAIQVYYTLCKCTNWTPQKRLEIKLTFDLVEASSPKTIHQF